MSRCVRCGRSEGPGRRRAAPLNQVGVDPVSVLSWENVGVSYRSEIRVQISRKGVACGANIAWSVVDGAMWLSGKGMHATECNF